MSTQSVWVVEAFIMISSIVVSGTTLLVEFEFVKHGIESHKRLPVQVQCVPVRKYHVASNITGGSTLSGTVAARVN